MYKNIDSLFQELTYIYTMSTVSVIFLLLI